MLRIAWLDGRMLEWRQFNNGREDEATKHGET